VTNHAAHADDDQRLPALTAAELDAATDTARAAFAHALTDHMSAHNLGVREVARAAGISPGTIVGIREGRTLPEGRVIARLEAALRTRLWPVHD